MIKMITLIAVALTLLLGTNACASDIQKGILQYKWGDSTAGYNGLSKLADKGEVSYYSKPGEIYTIGDVSVDKVIYGFYQDQLFGVYLNIDSIEVYDQLLQHLKSLYGLPAYKTTADNHLVYKWKQQDIIIKLKMNKPGRKMKLAFYYRPLSSKLNALQWEDLDTTTFRFVPIEKDKKPEKFILVTF
jgi:hypothetical protein